MKRGKSLDLGFGNGRKMKRGTYPEKKKINGKLYVRVAINPNFDIEDSYEHTETLRYQGKAARIVREPGASHHAVYFRIRK